MKLRVIPALLLVCLAGPVSRGQQGSVEGPLPVAPAGKKTALDNDAVIRMTKAGLDTFLIVETVRTQPGRYATGPDDLIALKEAGVPPAVITAMMARSAGLTQRAPDAVTVTALSPEMDEQGVYHKDREGKWVELPPELVHYKSGGWAKSTLTHDIVKQDRNGEIAGAQSPLILRPGDELEIVAPPNVDAIEYQVLRFRLHDKSREFRATTGGVFHSRDGTERDQVLVQAKRIAPRVFSLTLPADIGGGEFGVLPPGSASVPGIGFAGKIYTFAITIDK